MHEIKHMCYLYLPDAANCQLADEMLILGGVGGCETDIYWPYTQ